MQSEELLNKIKIKLEKTEIIGRSLWPWKQEIKNKRIRIRIKWCQYME